MMFAFMALWLAGWILAARLRRPGIPPGTSDPMATSIIIPARNEAHNLPTLPDILGLNQLQFLFP